MKLVLPSENFDAYLFDCDGTIVDSMPVHYEAWITALSEHGGHFPEDLFYAWAGMPLGKTVEKLNEKFGLSMPVDRILKRKEELFYEYLHKLRPVRSVLRHIEEQHGKILFAVVSGSPRDSVKKSLEAVGLLGHFPVIVGAEDYSRGKPDPEPFLLAAKLLGVRPEKCLVFEDAEMGIAAARAAGMAWVHVPRQELAQPVS
jgi:HAD superfamily hydrolase (TIGR01509 family)